MSLAGRTLRRIGLDRNPLRRTVDRVEALITIFLMVAAIFVVPGAAWLAGRAAYESGLRTEQFERTHRFQVDAVLLAEAGTDPGGSSSHQRHAAFPPRGAGPAQGLRTAARWAGVDGSTHQGSVLASSGAHAGSTVPVWTDVHGNLINPPQQRSQTKVNAVGVAALTATAAGCVLAALRMLIHHGFDVRRMAQWQAAWWRFEPRWTGRS
jgi:hypothetical protein